MIPHIQIRKGNRQILLFRDEEQLHLVNMDKLLTKEIKEEILEKGCTPDEMQSMGLSGVTIAIRDLEGVAVYDYAAGADLEFHFGKKKQCYKLSKRCEPHQLDAFFKGIPRIPTPASRVKAPGRKGVDWRANLQDPERLSMMKGISIGLNALSVLVLVGMVALPVYRKWLDLAAILCGMAGVFLAVAWQEYFTFFDSHSRRKVKIRSKTYSVLFALFPMIFATLRWSQPYSFFADDPLLIYAGALGLAGGLLLTVLTRDLRERFDEAAFVIFIAIAMSIGIVAHTNHVFASEPMEVHQISVVDQYSSSGKTKSCYLTVIIPEHGELDLRVSRSVYDQYSEGDLIWISTRTGAWGLEYGMLGSEE